MKTDKNQPNNPFVITGYYSPKYFCDREKDTARIIESMQNHRNVALLSLRRMGKTGLIDHVFHCVKIKPKYDCFYIDIYPTSNLADFVKLLSKAIIGQLDSKVENIFKKASELFKSIRPVFTFDPINSSLKIEISLSNESRPETSLDELFAYLQQKASPVIVAIDEFQQIAQYPEKNTEALLRSYIQRMTNVGFIYAGSQNHLIQNMFTSYKHPFYQSAELLFLQAIPLEYYRQFVHRRMKDGNKTISFEAVDYLYSELFGHTWYMQYTLNRLYTAPFDVITPTEIQWQLDEIARENVTLYLSYRNLLTSTQWALMQAIGKEKEVKEPTSQIFTQKYGLSASSVQRALKTLMDKDMIYEENGKYYIYNQFLAYWLRVTY